MAGATTGEHVLEPGVRLALIGMGAAAFLVTLDRAIMAPLLPAMAGDLKGTIAQAGMSVTAYVIPYGLFQLFYGPLADRAGKTAVIRWAVLAFLVVLSVITYLDRVCLSVASVRMQDDLGIAEQHSVTFAAGLACEGMKPVVAIYSTFLQRAYDQLIHDVALQNLPVVFAIDRGGIVGADGATHIGAYDLAYLRCVPNMTVMAPADENECRQMLYTAFTLDTPAAVRYPRGAGPGVAVDAGMTALPVGKAEVRRVCSRRADRVAILSFGAPLRHALAAGDELDATVANMRFVKPLDAALVAKLAHDHDALVTVEENVVMGGAGSAVGEALAAAGIAIPLLQLGLPDAFIDHGDPAELLAACGLDAPGIVAAVQARFGHRRPEAVRKPAA